MQVSVPVLDVDTDSDAIDAFARELLALPGVVRVDAGTGSYGVVPDDALAEVLTALGVEKVDDERFIVPADLVGEELTARFTPDDGGRGTWLSVVPDVERILQRGRSARGEHPRTWTRRSTSVSRARARASWTRRTRCSAVCRG